MKDKRSQNEAILNTITEKKVCSRQNQREKNYQDNLSPYKNGRELDEIDNEILKILVDAKFAISDIYQKMQNMEQAERAGRLQSDLNCIIHIWKKKDGSI